MSNISTYRNDAALSNYPFVDNVLLPFPASLIRDIRLLRASDASGINTDSVRLKTLTCSDGIVSMVFSNGCHCTLRGSHEPGVIYDTSKRRRGWARAGSVPVDLEINVVCDIQLDPRCLADMCGRESEPGSAVVEVNGIPYTIKDTIKLQFNSDFVASPTYPRFNSIDGWWTIACPEVTADPSLFDVQAEDSRDSVASITVDGENVSMEVLDPLDDSLDAENEIPTLMIETVWPIVCYDERKVDIYPSSTLVLRLDGKLDCDTCFKDVPSWRPEKYTEDE